MPQRCAPPASPALVSSAAAGAPVRLTFVNLARYPLRLYFIRSDGEAVRIAYMCIHLCVIYTYIYIYIYVYVYMYMYMYIIHIDGVNPCWWWAGGVCSLVVVVGCRGGREGAGGSADSHSHLCLIHKKTQHPHTYY